MSDIVERLRSPCNSDTAYYQRKEAADEIERLRAREANLLAAIRGMLEFYDDDPSDYDPWECLKAARRALEGKE